MGATRTGATRLLVANRGEIAVRDPARRRRPRLVARWRCTPPTTSRRSHVRRADEARDRCPAPVSPATSTSTRWWPPLGRRVATPSIRATASWPRTPPSPAAAPRRASTSSDPRPRSWSSSATRSPPATWPGVAPFPCWPAPTAPPRVEEAGRLPRRLGEGGAVMIKAVAGGGGRGMRAVTRPEDLEEASRPLPLGGARRRSATATSTSSSCCPGPGTSRCRSSGTAAARCHAPRRAGVHDPAPPPEVGGAGAEPQPDRRRSAASCSTPRCASPGRSATPASAPSSSCSTRRPAPTGWAFIEANPRLQVEHTVTEEVTGVDLVAAQLRLAMGATLAEVGLTQAEVPAPRGYAVQVRVNTETLEADGTTKPAGGTLDRLRRAGRAGRAGRHLRLRRLHDQPPLRLAAGQGHRPWRRPRLRRRGRPHRPGAGRAGGREACPPTSACSEPSSPTPTSSPSGSTPPSSRPTSRSCAPRPPPSRRRPAPLGVGPGRWRRRCSPATAWPARGSTLPTPWRCWPTANRRRAPRRPWPSPPVASPAPAPAAPFAPGPDGTVAAGGAAAGHGRRLRRGRGRPRPRRPAGAGHGGHEDGARGRRHGERTGADAGRRRRATRCSRAMPWRGSRSGRSTSRAAAPRRRSTSTPSAPTSPRCWNARPSPSTGSGPTRWSGGGGPASAPPGRTSRTSATPAPTSSTAHWSWPPSAGAVPSTTSIQRTQADGMLAGIGRVNGAHFDDDRAQCVVMSYDYTVLAGTQGTLNHLKKDRMFELAQKWRLPVVFFTEGGGGRPGDTDGRGAGLDCMAFAYWGELSGLVPLVGINSGRCFAGNAALLGCCDVIIATENSLDRHGRPRHDRGRWARRVPARGGRPDVGAGAERGRRRRRGGRGRRGGRRQALPVLLPGPAGRLGLRRPAAAAAGDPREPPPQLRHPLGHRHDGRHRLGARAASDVRHRHGHRAGAGGGAAARGHRQQPDAPRRAPSTPTAPTRRPASCSSATPSTSRCCSFRTRRG